MYKLPICLLFFFWVYKANAIPNVNIIAGLKENQDSTTRERFIVQLLSEYDQKGRWVFVTIWNCDNQASFEIVQPISLYKAFADTQTDTLEKKQFVWLAYTNIITNQGFYNCLKTIKLYSPKASYEIEGTKVNMKKVNSLKRMGIKKILSSFFTNERKIRKQYRKDIVEIIAVCILYNVKVITNENEDAEYEMFK